MKKKMIFWGELIFLLILAAACLCIGLVVFPRDTHAAPRHREAYVSTAEELLAVIAPDTTVYLAPGEYDLWGALAISGVHDLHLTGGGSDSVTITGAIEIEDCENISLSGVTVSGEELTGAAVSMTKAKNVIITGCGLTGSGMEGIFAADCTDIEIAETEISFCGIGGADMYYCENVTLTDCGIHDCAFPTFHVVGSENVSCNGEAIPTGSIDIPSAGPYHKPGEIAFSGLVGSDLTGKRLVSLYAAAGAETAPAQSSELDEETRTLLQDYAGAYPALSYQNFALGGVPLLRVCRKDAAEPPLMIFLHGLGQNKERLLTILSAYAEAGYCVLALDAYDHGQRFSDEMVCDFWASMLLTVRDIETVVEYYKKASPAGAFVLGGFSMGAVESWAYTELGKYKPAAMVAFSGVCEYDAWQPALRDRLPFMWLAPSDSSVWVFDETQEHGYTVEKLDSIQSLSVTRNLNAFSDVPVFCGIGSEDNFFLAEEAGRVTGEIAAAGNTGVTFQEYSGVGHQITAEMVTDSIAFLREHMETKNRHDLQGHAGSRFVV